MVVSAFNYLVGGGFVTPYNSVIPQNTVQHLIASKIVKPFPTEEEALSDLKKVEKKRSTFPLWVVWVFVFIVLRGFFSFYNSSNSIDNRPYPPPADKITVEKLLPQETALQEKANKGDANAQYLLGMDYLEKSNLDRRNLKKALSWLQLSANQNHAPAQETLGILYYTGEAGGRDYPKAIELLTSATNSGRADATLWLGRAYGEGNGVKKDPIKSNELILRSSELGSTEGRRIIGTQLIYAAGPTQDIEKGIDYLNQAANKGNIQAKFQLALEYMKGSHVEIDYNKAAELLNTVENRRIPIVEFWLSQLYDKGLGVKLDQSKSKQLMSSAKKNANTWIINNFSWSLATFPNKSLRNGSLAVELMEELLTDPENSSNVAWIDTLAAGYAAMGNFEKAAEVQQRAIDLLPDDVPSNTRGSFLYRQVSYQEGRVTIEP